MEAAKGDRATRRRPQGHLLTNYGHSRLRFGGPCVSRRLSEAGEDAILTDCEVESIESTETKVVIEVKGRASFRDSHAIVAAGLRSDRLAKRSGYSDTPRIVPFRGSYLQLRGEKRYPVKSLNYPVPDPDLPFLGVHFTRKLVDGAIWIGPNAVLALSREGYRRGAVDWRDTRDLLSYGGFWKMAGRNWRTGLAEYYREIFQQRYVELAQRYLPKLGVDDVESGPTGIRAQTVETKPRPIQSPYTFHECPTHGNNLESRYGGTR